MADTPESRFVLTLGDDDIALERPDGGIERTAFSRLRKVSIVTNDTGPWGIDVWWVLEGASPGERVTCPQDAINEQTLLHRLMDLPGFDNEELIEAMTSVENGAFLCWQARAQP